MKRLMYASCAQHTDLSPARELLTFAKPLMECVAVDRAAANPLGELPPPLNPGDYE